MPRTRAQRAQQFQAYDALKGFTELLHEKERIVIQKKDLSEDDYEELNEKASRLQTGKMVSIIHYDKNEYIKTTGILSRIDPELGFHKKKKYPSQHEKILLFLRFICCQRQ